MTGDELYAARRTLGELWGFGRPLKASELGRACRLGGRDPGESIRDYERGKTQISGPLSALIELYLRGVLPPDGLGQGRDEPSERAASGGGSRGSAPRA